MRCCWLNYVSIKNDMLCHTIGWLVSNILILIHHHKKKCMHPDENIQKIITLLDGTDPKAIPAIAGICEKYQQKFPMPQKLLLVVNNKTGTSG